MDRWLIREGEAVSGPVDDDTLRDYFSDGLTENRWFKCETSVQWIPASAFHASGPDVPKIGLGGAPVNSASSASLGRPVTIWGGIIVVICFFLPWVQTGCGKLSGSDLAKTDEALGLVFVAGIVAVLVAGLSRDVHEKATRLAIVIPSGLAFLLIIAKVLRVHDNAMARNLISVEPAGLGTVGGLIATMIGPLLNEFSANPASRMAGIDGAAGTSSGQTNTGHIIIALAVAVALFGGWRQWQRAECESRCQVDCVREAAALNPFQGFSRNELGEAACRSRVELCRATCH